MDNDELLYELGQCREDERASKAHIFQILAVVATFLTVLTALANSDGVSKELYALIYLLTIFAASAAVSYIANLGMLSTFRHYYIVDLEKRIRQQLKADGKKAILHWDSVSKPLVTLNPKHIGSGLFILFPLNATISFVSILALGLTFVVLELITILRRFSSLSVFAWSLAGLFTLVLIICSITLMVSLRETKKIYDQACEKAINQDWANYKLAKGVISYYIYPRIKDVQKVIFIVLGYVTGRLLNFPVATEYSFPNDALTLFITILVVDGLVYQARYLWNDIRGAGEDQDHPLKEKRQRLPITALGLKSAIGVAWLTIVLRILGAAIFIRLPDVRPVLLPCVLILLLGCGYEFARAIGHAKLTIILVCLGYPLRWIAGFCVACPAINIFAINDWQIFMTVWPILFATWAFGGAFVTMTWVLESVYLFMEKAEIKKQHHKILFQKLDKSTLDMNPSSPIKDLGGKEFTWNKFFAFSSINLTVAAMAQALPHWNWCSAVIGIGAVSLFLTQKKKYNVKTLLGSAICFTASCVYYLQIRYFRRNSYCSVQHCFCRCSI